MQNYISFHHGKHKTYNKNEFLIKDYELDCEDLCKEFGVDCADGKSNFFRSRAC